MNLGPVRYIIQKNVDSAISPEIPEDTVSIRMVRQTPAIISDSPGQSVDLLFGDYFTIDLKTEK